MWPGRRECCPISRMCTPSRHHSKRPLTETVWTGEGLGPEPRLHQWFTSQHNADQICVATGLSGTQLEKRIEEGSSKLVIWK